MQPHWKNDNNNNTNNDNDNDNDDDDDDDDNDNDDNNNSNNNNNNNNNSYNNVNNVLPSYPELELYTTPLHTNRNWRINSNIIKHMISKRQIKSKAAISAQELFSTKQCVHWPSTVDMFSVTIDNC